jgi:hypothetical protein
MKAILEFNLPEDNSEFNLASRAMRWYSAFYELDQHLRSRLKYEDSLSECAYEALDHTRTKLYEIMNENGISFDEVQ